MKTNKLLILSFTALISQVFAPHPQQQWEPSEQQWEPSELQWAQSEKQWEPSELQWAQSEQQWEPPVPQLEPSEPQWEPTEPQWEPVVPQLEPSEPQWEPPVPQWEPALPQWEPPVPQWEPTKPQWEPPVPQWEPTKPQWEPPVPQWEPTKPQWEPPVPQWDPTEPQWEPAVPQLEPSEPQWEPPVPQWEPSKQQWVSPEQNQWGGPPHFEWGPPQSEPSAEWYPRPENKCKGIPRNAKTMGITPIVEVDVTHDSVYPCDSTSRVKQISYHMTIRDHKESCNGIIVETTDLIYNLVYAEPSYGGKQKESVVLTNYTQIRTLNNGNLNFIECGTISSGRCAGDSFWGVAIFQADDQKGCCNGGNTGAVALYRLIQIKGKCESRCSLGRAIHVFAEPVSNRGFGFLGFQNEEATTIATTIARTKSE